MDRLANLLGALALAVADEQGRRMHSVSGLGPSALAALTTLGHYPGESVASLAGVLGLSHSATVRLADDLERRGLLTRTAKDDRRSVGLALTERGMALRAEAMDARTRVLTDALTALDLEERERFEAGLTQVLLGFATGRGATDHLCRLCDEAACGWDDCPVERRTAELGLP